MRPIIIDAGHGLSRRGTPDPGACGEGVTERELILLIVERLLRGLRAEDREAFTIGMVEPLTLEQHVQQANHLSHRLPSPLLISIHLNAGPPSARGVEAWYGTGKDPLLGRCLAESLSDATGIPRRPLLVLPSHENRHGSLAMLDKTIATSCLLECGFVTNKLDVTLVRENPDAVSAGIIAGIHSFEASTRAGCGG